MKILIIGNHTCSNLGDAAILRGLISEIRRLVPDAELEITSRHPRLSSRLIPFDLRDDPLYRWHAGRSGFRARVVKWVLPLIMSAAIRPGWAWLTKFLPGHVRREILHVRGFDGVFHVGGSFFVDIYGPVQFEYPLVAMLADRPVHLVGHSMGPFTGPAYSILARSLLKNVTSAWLREQVSRDLIVHAGLPTRQLQRGSDSAWLVPGTRRAPTSNIAAEPCTRKRIAISFRDLGIFASTLHVNQDEYEAALAMLVDQLLSLGYEVLGISTCTSIPDYAYDDRLVAARLRELLADASSFSIPEDGMSDADLGDLLSSCELVIATRLHSAIIAMNFGTPAIALCYEHKTLGVMTQLGLRNLAYPMQSLVDGTFRSAVVDLLPRLPELRRTVAIAVDMERAKARRMVERCLDCIAATEPPAPPAARTSSAPSQHGP